MHHKHPPTHTHPSNHTHVHTDVRRHPCACTRARFCPLLPNVASIYRFWPAKQGSGGRSPLINPLMPSDTGNQAGVIHFPGQRSAEPWRRTKEDALQPLVGVAINHVEKPRSSSGSGLLVFTTSPAAVQRDFCGIVQCQPSKKESKISSSSGEGRARTAVRKIDTFSDEKKRNGYFSECVFFFELLSMLVDACCGRAMF
ncbi:unnamed protein product [Gadus morhua 'NCC']